MESSLFLSPVSRETTDLQGVGLEEEKQQGTERTLRWGGHPLVALPRALMGAAPGPVTSLCHGIPASPTDGPVTPPAVQKRAEQPEAQGPPCPDVWWGGLHALWAPARRPLWPAALEQTLVFGLNARTKPGRPADTGHLWDQPDSAPPSPETGQRQSTGGQLNLNGTQVYTGIRLVGRWDSPGLLLWRSG